MPKAALQGISKERSSDGYQRRAQAASALRCALAIEVAACRGLKGWVVKRCVMPEEREEVEKKADVWKGIVILAIAAGIMFLICSIVTFITWCRRS
jgi:hypothetical protein